MNNLLAEMTKSQQASLGGGQQGRRAGGDGGQGPGQTYLKHCLQQASTTALGPRGPLASQRPKLV